MTDHTHIQDCMNEIIFTLEEGGASARERVSRAFSFLIPLFQRIRAEGVSQDRLKYFKSKLSRLISSDSNFMGLYHYMSDCSHYAELGRLNGFKEACLMRSVLQIFNDEFIIWSESQREDLKNEYTIEIFDIDEILRDVSDEAPPLLKEEIPSWAPESHWWWHSPEQQDMSEAERKSRLEYDHWDGVND